MDELIDLRSVQAVDEESEPANALEYLQDIYKGRRVFDPQRFRAAKEALPYESPRLAVVAALGDDGSTAEQLERALVRSGVKLIVNQQQEREPDPNDR
jgi:hypothetical protein